MVSAKKSDPISAARARLAALEAAKARRDEVTQLRAKLKSLTARKKK